MKVGPVPTEREVQRRVVRLLELAGLRAFNLAQGYRPGGRRHGTTRQSKGLPDLYVIGAGLSLWVEVKRPGGKQRPEQAAFQAACGRARVPYVLGGYREVLQFLVDRGLWRLPAGVTVDDVARPAA